MAKNTTAETSVPVSTPEVPALVTVRVTKNGVHAGGFILGKGAIVRLTRPDAEGLVSSGAAVALN